MTEQDFTSPEVTVALLVILCVGYALGYGFARMFPMLCTPLTPFWALTWRVLTYALGLAALLARIGFWEPLFLITLPVFLSIFVLGPFFALWLPLLMLPAFFYGRDTGLARAASP